MKRKTLIYLCTSFILWVSTAWFNIYMHRQGTELSMVLNEAFLPLLGGVALTVTYSIFLFVKIKKKVAVILLVLAFVISVCLTIFFAISGWNEYSHYNEKNIEVVHATITMKH